MSIPDTTDLINRNNQNVIDLLIKNKVKYDKAYYSTTETPTLVTTDMDRFPYPRWFRGMPDSYKPVIVEREAGYHMIIKEKKEAKEKGEYPKHVFASPCSTVLPVYAKEAFDPKTVSQYCVDKFQ
jgi:hypothetical protein